MTVSEFLAWAQLQPEGCRHELVDGEMIAMAPERAFHNLAKFTVARALDDAVREARLPCTVFTDGIAVRINERATREPDASVQCGIEVDLNSTLLEAPLIVVEVPSPSSERDDTGAKLIDYFSVPSIRHYLIVFPGQGAVVHHQRGEHGNIDTRIAHDGEISLSPPGVTVLVAALLGRRSSGADESG